MNAATLMDRVFDLYKNTFKVQIAFSLIIGIISFTLMMVLGIALAVGVSAVIASSGGLYLYDHSIVWAVGLTLLAILPLYVGWLYLSASGHILISKQSFYDDPIEMPIGDTINAFFRVMSAALAQIILSLPWFFLLAFIIYLATSGFGDIFDFIISIPPLTLVLTGFVYVIIYVIYSNIFALSVPVALFEKRLFFTTVTRSYQLLKGNFWSILGLRMLWAVLVYLISYSAQSLMMVIIAIVAALAGNVIEFTELWFATSTLQIYASLFIGIIVGPMEGIMTALIYFNQKIKKDGLDIEIGLHRLSKNAL